MSDNGSDAEAKELVSIIIRLQEENQNLNTENKKLKKILHQIEVDRNKPVSKDGGCDDN